MQNADKTNAEQTVKANTMQSNVDEYGGKTGARCQGESVEEAGKISGIPQHMFLICPRYFISISILHRL